MTTTAHNAKRVYGGASLAKNMHPLDRPETPVSLYQELYPYMYKPVKRKKAVRATELSNKITAWLTEHGSGSAPEIGKALGVIQQTVIHSLQRNVEGATVIGYRFIERGKKEQVWAIRHDEEGEGDE